MTTHQPVHDAVQEYYGQLLRSTKDLKTTGMYDGVSFQLQATHMSLAASCCRRAPNSVIADIMSKIPRPVKEKVSARQSYIGRAVAHALVIVLWVWKPYSAWNPGKARAGLGMREWARLLYCCCTGWRKWTGDWHRHDGRAAASGMR